MNFKELNPQNTTKIAKLSENLQENFGVKIKSDLPKQRLERISENAKQTLIHLRGTHKKFHLEPEYAKFLGIRELAESMLQEGMYVESPAYMEMKHYVEEMVCGLMDSGYTMEEACHECMNRFRKDPRYAYDDAHVLPIIEDCARAYAEGLGGAIQGAAIGSRMGPVGAVAGAAIGNKLLDDEFDEAIDELVTEDVNIDEAEVVMAARALSSDIQDQVERIGRMVNEEVPAIVDQMQIDMGADTATSFKASITDLLNTYLEAAKTAKESVDAQVSQLAGGAAPDMMSDAPMDDSDLGLPSDELDIGGDEFGAGDAEAMDDMGDDEVDADKPLGRAAV
jgi:hypothetical protein